MAKEWNPTPLDLSDLDFSGDKLRLHWDALHAGNLEPFPDDESVQQAWRLYHQGQFSAAADLGRKAGGAALVPAAFATTIYAQYVETDPDTRPKLFKEAVALCEQAKAAGVDTPNVHYMHAVSMGRYSQFISMIEALAQGFGGKIKDAAERCLELAPKHAEALVTLGGWHAAITDQAGSLMGRMLYGATQDGAHENYDEAVRVLPLSPVVHLEYARGMEVMYGNSEKARILSELDAALALTPVDAMQRLDVALGRADRARLGA